MSLIFENLLILCSFQDQLNNLFIWLTPLLSGLLLVLNVSLYPIIMFSEDILFTTFIIFCYFIIIIYYF